MHFLLDQAIEPIMNDAQLEEIKRYFGVVAETLRDDICQIAGDHSWIRHEIQGLREEFREELRALMRLSFSQLDQWIHTPETDISILKARMDRLESLRA